MKIIRFVLGLSIGILTINALAATIIPNYSVQAYDQKIQNIYHNPALKTSDMPTRLEIISAAFLGKPYLNDSLGEGKNAPFDQHPLYRTDTFDCLTYVSTVLALAESNNLTEFKQNILKTQYFHAVPIFVNRLHFTDNDWNRTNAQNGFIQDITLSFKNNQGKSIAEFARTLINKPAWYQKMPDSRLIFIHPLSPPQEKERLTELHSLSHQVKAEEVQVPYLPFSVLFNAQSKPNLFIFNQIPSGAIIEIVRPNWNLEQAIGTHLNISHLGFVFRTSQGLIFREASSLEHRVIDVPLIAYLKNYINSPSVKGINVQKISLQQ